MKRKFEQDHLVTLAASNEKHMNPFAKKKMESLAKEIVKVVDSSPTKEVSDSDVAC